MRRKARPNWGYLKYLLYWPAFGVMFGALERLWAPAYWISTGSALDRAIPFCEWFMLPYLFWFVFLTGAHVYTFFYEPEEFRRLMAFIALSYTIGLLFFMAFPTCQDLRPVTFERDNILTRLVGAFYALDTNTNVCPSLHVVGSVAAALGMGRRGRLAAPAGRAALTGMAALISLSTVFVKQHAVLDVVCALAVCGVTYMAVYGGALSPSRHKAEGVRCG